MSVYYNENDPDVVRWLEYLVAENLIPAGYIDSRSVVDVRPADLDGFHQCHFFAGIAGWARACDLAGWPRDRPVWTASCPCQGESVAGKKRGKDDPRHLWPDFFRLVRACRPVFVCGEQVARAAGTHWLDGVLADLESAGYTAGAVDIPACAVNAPHIRSRLYWLAHAIQQSGWSGSVESGKSRRQEFANGNGACGLVNAQGIGWRERRSQSELRRGWSAVAGTDVSDGVLDDANSTRRLQSQRGVGEQRRRITNPDGRDDFWADAEWIQCHDNRQRRTKSGTSLLDARFPGRVAAWRGLGNAIVPPLAAEVLKAYLDIYP